MKTEEIQQMFVQFEQAVCASRRCKSGVSPRKRR